MIVSMKPAYEISNTILMLITSISEKLGEVSATHLHKPSPELRRRNRIKTIQASLEIEGNTLTEAQITAIIDNKRVSGPSKDILEVMNAVEVYHQLGKFDPENLKSFLKAHKILMNGLIPSPGNFRLKGVGIVKGKQIAHIAPPADNLPYLMKDLFEYLKNKDEPALIKSCVLHYEIEFIHPFMDGNGRMGRLWQTLILLKSYPVFEYLPFETIIKDRQEEYYHVLSKSDKVGKSTFFIEFILRAIEESLEELLTLQHRILSTKGRVDYFILVSRDTSFSRKDYMRVFKDISSATASRDLRYAVKENIIRKEGDKRKTRYWVNT